MSQLSGFFWQKNGGRLTGDHLQADYAILYSRSAAFKDLLAGIQSVGRPALTPMFVEDCINAEALLDPDEGRGHIIDAKLGDNSKSGSHAATGTGRTPRDNKPTTRFPKKRAEKRIGKDAGSAPGIRPTDASDTSSAALLGHLQRRDPSTPSPPPVDERNRKSDGRWSFTAEEKAFVLKYGHVLIQRDVSVANIAIARKIQEKVCSLA